MMTEGKQNGEAERFGNRANELLRRTLVGLSSCRTFSDALNYLLDAALDLTGMEGGGIYIVEEGVAVLRFHRGFSDAFIREVERMPLDLPIVEAVLSLSGPANLVKDFNYMKKTFNRHGIRRVFSFPLRFGGELFGFLNVGSASARKGQMSDIEILRIITEEAGALLHRLKTDKALRESEERFRKIFEEGPLGMSLVGLDFRYRSANSRLCQITGYSEEELKARTVMDITYAEDLGKDTDLANKVVRGEIPFFSIEKRYVRKDEKVIWISLTVSIMRSEAGDPLYFIGMIEDISERKEAESRVSKLNDELSLKVKELAAANKELETFSSSVSHDLRAPLRFILSFSKMLLEGHTAGLDKKAAKLLGSIHDYAVKTDELIRALFSLSKVGRQRLAFAPLNLERLAREVLDEIKAISPKKEMKFIVNAMPDAVGDFVLMRQVLFNLLENAVKFSRPRALVLIEIGGEMRGEENIYYVRDNGIGMDMQFTEKIFEPFHRIQTEEDFEGAGIGLSIARRIITRHGGRIWVESRPGQGATFFFSLPKRT